MYNKHVSVSLGRRVGATEGQWLTSGYFCLCEQDMTGLACQAPCGHEPPELHTCTLIHILTHNCAAATYMNIHAHTSYSSAHVTVRLSLRDREAH